MALTISINQAAAFTVNVGVPGPTGPAGPQGPAGPAGAGGVWGSITGTLGNQTDLASALAGKYSTSNPAGYIDLTTAGLYFYPLTGNPGGFATQAWVISQNYLTASSLDSYATQSWVNTQLAGYALQSWVTDHAYPLVGNPSGFLTSASLSGYATQGWVNTQLADYATLTYVNASFYGIDNPDGFITSAALTGYLLSSTAASTYQTIAGMSSYLTTSAAASTYAVIARGLPASGTAGQVLTKVNGTDYNATWSTIIPGDRYLTTSTSAMSISNGAKTFTAGTGLSYTPTQDVTIAHDSANHMHGTVTSYDSGTGAMVVEVQNHSGAGTYNSWTINVGGTVPVASVIWGDITGTLGLQTDLANALNAKLETTTAASTYQTISGMSSYLSKADNLSGLASTSTARTNLGLGSLAVINDAPSDGSQYARKNGAWDVVSSGGSYITSVTSPLAVTSGNLSVDLSGYLPLSGGAMTGDSTITNGSAISYIGSSLLGLQNGFDYGYVEPNSLKAEHSETLTYGTDTYTTTVTGQQTSFAFSGYDNLGARSGSGSINFNSLSLSYTSSSLSRSSLLSGDGVSGTISNYGTTTNWGLSGSGLVWNNGTVYGEFNSSGIRFPDGSIQSTAAYYSPPGWTYNFGQIAGDLTLGATYSNPTGSAPLAGNVLGFNGSYLQWVSVPSAPPYSEAVWAYGNWYSATIKTVYDTSYNYVNVLTL